MSEHESYRFDGEATVCSCGQVIAEEGTGPDVYRLWLAHIDESSSS